MVNGTNFKVGDKVRIFDADRIGGGFDITNGRVYKVSKVDSDGGFNLLDDANDSLFISEDEYEHLEKVSDKPTKNQRIKSLEETVEQLKARVEQLGALVEAKQPTITNVITAKSDVDIPGIAAKLAEHIKRGYEKQLTPNQKRKAIIAEAKAFVEENLTEVDQQMGWKTTKVPLYADKGRLQVNFHDNIEKRTVVALVYYGNLYPEDKTVLAKGIAKCAPDDVFNADIGKAIALGRALGLDVSKFEQAVKPTEFAVGQIVDVKCVTGGTYLVGEVTKVVSERCLYFEKQSASDYCGVGEFYPSNAVNVPHGSKINDDTEAVYE